ncbi:cation:proton antiporter [Parahaliea mediterranea]|uniref:Sodium:proton antiporter n=1 Tax=Parahaliea mediterranea TaxID=651086 RepID=A0A939DJF0_9GAMM|nr:sodium:proton antiporter [Parahaliea mediterranea]MBN7798622.1 sodium:proton antiporter [Parahaliea mediterranea]
MPHLELSLALVLVIATLCQWLAWRVRLPAILFLLLAGLVAGPVSGWLQPDAVFGDLLMPLVSLSVAIILFEGSLTLDFAEIRGVGRVVQRMITIGALVTWVIVATATHYIFDFSWQVSALFGAVVIVTGPTVIVPMLRSVRPTRKVANILRWEGIAIDPIGALMAVMTYEFILVSTDQPAFGHVLALFLETLAVGTVSGIAAGFLLGRLLTRNWLPEYLHNIATLCLVLLSFSAANAVAHESGLLAVTVMGMWLANQRDVDIHPILNFKEHLSLLLISVLFVVLAARIDLGQLADIGWKALVLLAVLQLVARPAKVLVSTLGLDVSWRERGLLAWIAPRGIVAAAISALFADSLVAVGYSEAALLVPLTFTVIIGTVVLQSATARPLARLLGVSEPSPRGFLIVGANAFSRAVAQALKEHDFRCVLADSSREDIRAARMAGLETYYGNPVSEHAEIHLDLAGIGGLLAMSRQRYVNVIAAIHYRQDFGERRIFRLASDLTRRKAEKHQVTQGYQGSQLFGEDITYGEVMTRVNRGWEIRSTRLTEEFGWEQYRARNGEDCLPLFVIDGKGWITPFTEGGDLAPTAGCTVLALVPDDTVANGAAGSGAAGDGMADKMAADKGLT